VLVKHQALAVLRLLAVAADPVILVPMQQPMGLQVAAVLSVPSQII
jgi:hypothetical protein